MCKARADLTADHLGSELRHQPPAPDEDDERNKELLLGILCTALREVLSIACLITLYKYGEFDLLMYSMCILMLVMHLVVYHVIRRITLSLIGYVNESESVWLRNQLICWGLLFTVMFICRSCRDTLPGYISKGLPMYGLVYMLGKYFFGIWKRLI